MVKSNKKTQKAQQKPVDIITAANRRLVTTTLVVAAFVIAFSVFFFNFLGLGQIISESFSKLANNIIVDEEELDKSEHRQNFETRIAELLDSQTKNNSLKRTLLGVKYVTVNDSVAKEYNLSVKEGAYLGAVSEGGAADNAGLKPGDVITFVNKTRVTADNPLNYLIAKYGVGDTISITYSRNGKERVAKVVLTTQE